MGRLRRRGSRGSIIQGGWRCEWGVEEAGSGVWGIFGIGKERWGKMGERLVRLACAW